MNFIVEITVITTSLLQKLLNIFCANSFGIMIYEIAKVLMYGTHVSYCEVNISTKGAWMWKIALLYVLLQHRTQKVYQKVYLLIFDMSKNKLEAGVQRSHLSVCEPGIRLSPAQACDNIMDLCNITFQIIHSYTLLHPTKQQI